MSCYQDDRQEIYLQVEIEPTESLLSNMLLRYKQSLKPLTTVIEILPLVLHQPCTMIDTRPHHPYQEPSFSRHLVIFLMQALHLIPCISQRCSAVVEVNRIVVRAYIWG